MVSFRNKFIAFIEKYLVYILIGFGILSLLPYVTVFKGLESNNTAGIVYRGILTSLLVILFLIGLICYKKLPNKLALIGCLIYLISQFVTIFASPLIKEVEIPSIQTFVGISMIFTNIISLFIALYMIKYHNLDHEALNIVCYFLIGIGVAACLYTYIFQYKEIGSVLTNEHGWNFQVTSIFTTKGIYGFVLLISSIFTVILALNTRKYWLYAFPVFFLFNTFLCRAKAEILCITIILIFAFVYHLIHSWNKHKKAWTITISVCAGLVLIFSLLIFVPGLQFGPFKTLNYYFTKTIFNDGITVTKDRIYKVGNIFKAIDYPLGVMFGCGERITNYIIAPAGAEVRGDCQYAANYATGGIIKSVLYLAFAIYAIYKIAKTKGEYKSFSILFIVIILLTGLFDDNSILGINLCFFLTAPFIYSFPFKKEEIK